MKNKNKQINTISDLIEALKVFQDRFGDDLQIRVWDSNYNCEYDYDESSSIVNLIVKNDFAYIKDDDEDKVLIIKTS